MNKLAIIAAAALTAGTFGAVAIAQDASFGAADANGDGVVSFDEAFAVYPGLTQDVFNQADSNGDGSLDDIEFAGLGAAAFPSGTADPDDEETSVDTGVTVTDDIESSSSAPADSSSSEPDESSSSSAL